jgi:NhaP-type Na+/H+ or K+/H+ antiporter
LPTNTRRTEWRARTRAPPTVAFLAWFGPRGLASIVFAVIVVEESGYRTST